MVETGKYSEFFKVYLPQFSSHELVVPPAFIDILEKPLPKEASLLDHTGKLWRLETETKDTEERVCVLFKKGWETFAKDQFLEFGDFLVFRYDGDSRFYVKIFAQDGCRKDLGVATSTNSANKNPNVVVTEEPEYVSKTESTRRKLNRSGGHQFVELEPVYKPKNPHFVRTITKSSLNRLEIPPSLLKSNGIDLEGEIELCDEEGNKWPSKIVKDDVGMRISSDSWLCFRKAHKLIKTSKWLFEFIVQSNGKCNEIQVRQLADTVVTTTTRYHYQVVAI